MHHVDTSVVSNLWTTDISTKAELHKSTVSCALMNIGTKCLTTERNVGTCAKGSIFAKSTHIHGLYISRELFDQLISVYSVFSRIWDFILPFSFKTREIDIGHAPIRFWQLGASIGSNGKLESFDEPWIAVQICLLAC